ncbi:transposase [Aeoliella straminimaris]|uniref:transposase n=1 Tax=Aeoliella straminimaris TaxID=2954799 RepID=UPI003CC6C104
MPENITLVQLPACSPKLNPIEGLWNYLKSHFCGATPGLLEKRFKRAVVFSRC